jgi:hypothetical protein
MSLLKVISSTLTGYAGVVVPLDSLPEIATSFTFLGKEFNVVQSGGGVLVLVDEKDSIVFQVIPDIVYSPKGIIKDPKDLRFNKEIDLFFETKEIRLNVGVGNLTEEYGVTYDALYRCIMREWNTISSAFPEHKASPMEHEPETNNYCLLNGWNWHSNYTLLLKDGCWSRKDINGRHI